MKAQSVVTFLRDSPGELPPLYLLGLLLFLIMTGMAQSCNDLFILLPQLKFLLEVQPL